MNSQRAKRVLALAIVVFAPAAAMVWYRMHQTSGFVATELILYPLLFGGAGVAIVLSLKHFFLNESIAELNAGHGTVWSDLLWGVLLCVAYFVLFFIERATLSELLASKPNMELLGLMLEMRERPLLLVTWFGPVLWIGIALYEELVRTFMLSELWSFSQNKAWVFAVVVFSAVVIGLVHWSQGPYGIVTIGIKSLVAGFFYLGWRRILPLVFAHVLYDGLQVATLLLTYPDG